MFSFREITPLRKLLMLKAMTGSESLVEATATPGNPCTFETDVAKALTQCKVLFTPVQSGTGDPSPENVRPISGWSGVTAAQFGSNVYDPTGNTEGKFINSIGGLQTSDPWQITDFISVDGSAYIIYDGITTPGSSPYSAWYGDEESLISTFKQQTGKNVLAVPSGAKYVRFSLCKSGATDDVDSFTLIPSAQSYTVTFPDGQTVYGGTLDAVNGVVTAAWAAKTVRGTDSFFASSGYIKSDAFDAFFYINDVYGSLGMCNMLKRSNAGIWGDVGYPNTFRINSTQCHINIANELLGITDYTQETLTTATQKLKAWLEELYNNGTPLIVVYPISTPYEIPLSDIPVPVTLIGDNVLWSDANGNLEVKYMKKG